MGLQQQNELQMIHLKRNRSSQKMSAFPTDESVVVDCSH